MAVEAPSTPSRRAVLGGGLAAAVTGVVGGGVAGCTREVEPPAEPPAPHPDVVRAEEAALRERRLIGAYDVAVQRAPDLAGRLAPVRAEHVAHLAALGVADLTSPPPAPAAGATSPPAPAGGPTSPTATGGGQPPTPPADAPPPLPDDPAALLPALADLERAAGTAHAEVAVVSGRGLAAVLASAAASEASHPLALQ